MVYRLILFPKKGNNVRYSVQDLIKAGFIVRIDNVGTGHVTVKPIYPILDEWSATKELDVPHPLTVIMLSLGTPVKF